MSLAANLMSRLKQIIDLDIQAMGLLTEIVNEIDDLALRALIISIIGDENSHIRFFTLLLSLAANDNSQRTSAIFQCPEVEKILQTEPLEKTPLPSAHNPVVDIPVSKENPSHCQTHDTKTEGKRIDRRSLNQRLVPAWVRITPPKKIKKIVWTFRG